MTTTLSTIDAALKIYFEGSLQNDVVLDHDVIGRFESNTDVTVDVTTGGRKIQRAHMFGLNRGTGARRENDYIPVPSGPKLKNSEVNLKKLLGAVQMTADVMKRAKTDRGAFANWAEMAMPNLVEGFRNDMDRMALGFGFGCLGRIASKDGSTIVLKDNAGIVDLDGAWLNFLEGDTLIAAAEIDAATIRGAGPPYTIRKVEQVDDEGNALTLDSAVPASWVVGDYLFLGDASGTSSAEGTTVKEFMGLRGIVDNGDLLEEFQGINRTEFRQWRSIVIDASASEEFNGVLGEDVLQFAYDELAIRRGGSPNLILAARYGQRQFWKELREDRAINDPSSYTGGKSGAMRMAFGDKTLEVSSARKMPSQSCYMLDTTNFIRHELGKIEWDDTTGAIFKQVTDAVGRKDEFYGYCRAYIELSSTKPGRNLRIDKLGIPYEP